MRYTIQMYCYHSTQDEYRSNNSIIDTLPHCSRVEEKRLVI